MNFFTNISHEFRTPLTLILGPLEELMASNKNQYSLSQTLGLIRKNVMRLLRLVNQLMDFRKIEVNKMNLRASENDLIVFVSDIIQSYKSVAQKRNIDLRLITAEPHLNVWMDVTMLEILEADNGQTALQLAFDHIPDLILCDVVIPGKDGLALTRIIKTDFRTSHNPVFMLSVIYQINRINGAVAVCKIAHK